MYPRFRAFNRHSFRWRAVALLVSVQASLMACGGENGEEVTVERRDSAGVEIVEVRPPTWPPAEIWQVHDSPSVEIGVTAGDPNYELYGVEGVVTNDLGEIVVAERDATIRFYGRDGKHLRTYEREGEGPGEAVGFFYMSGYRGDSLLLTTLQGQGRMIRLRYQFYHE